MTSLIVNPRESDAETHASLAPRRFRDLGGKTVGLLDSTKYNSDRILDALGELLMERYSLKGIVSDRKPYIDRPVPIEQAKELASLCDVVITAVGD